MSDPESVAAFSDKFIVKAKFVVDYLKHLEVMEFKKKKRTEERARESQKTKEIVYDSDEDEYSRSESDENDENDNDSINSGGEDVILAFIDDEEEVERPATTRSGRSINRRSEIDFFFF